jgi:hypothetical protein
LGSIPKTGLKSFDPRASASPKAACENASALSRRQRMIDAFEPPISETKRKENT